MQIVPLLSEVTNLSVYIEKIIGGQKLIVNVKRRQIPSSKFHTWAFEYVIMQTVELINQPLLAWGVVYIEIAHALLNLE